MPDSNQHSQRDNECPECREYDFPGYHDLVEQLEALRDAVEDHRDDGCTKCVATLAKLASYPASRQDGP